ncbi:MAG: hypothetical protein IRZ28_09060 [Steroidobacteraceae bacterium]|nr:hypothetical protein [Steroidobacteraceae bacterium]
MRGLSLAALLPISSALTLLVACTGSEGNSPAQAPAAAQTAEAPPSGDRKEVLAPIESAEVIVRESAPPQYALRVVSGLPSGCAKFSRIEHKRQDAVIDVTVWNTVPARDDVVCTMIYGTSDNTVTLGSDFESGRTYEVHINGEPRTQFTAQ